MRFVVIGILLAFLAGAIYVGHYGWVSAGDVTMPAWGWLMMGLGIFFTRVIGGGLMILIFYSSRAGYDEAPQIEYDDGSDARQLRKAKRRQGVSAGLRSSRIGDKRSGGAIRRAFTHRLP